MEVNNLGTPHRVLVVDDEEIISATLARIFAVHGYQARAAYSAEQAMEIISEWSPDLAIIDVFLPGLNGVEFAVHLLAHCPQCRLVLFSGRPESAEIVEQAAKDGHSFEILPKPVHPSFLLDWASRLASAKSSSTN
jgi:DNA-binding NtrC family response regulator